jgi:hypothetical protein
MVETLFAFIMVFNGHTYEMDYNLTAEDCASRIVEYAGQFGAESFSCVLQEE